MSKALRYYRISEPALRELLMAAHKNWARECGGVDNWEWDGASIQNYIEDCSMTDFVHYEDLEEIVEADLADYEICTCPEKPKPIVEAFMECFGL